MIVEWIGGEASFYRHVLNRSTDFIEFRAIRKSKASSSRREAAEQADKPGGKESDANGDARLERPSRDQIGPQKWKHEKVGPDHEL